MDVGNPDEYLKCTVKRKSIVQHMSTILRGLYIFHLIPVLFQQSHHNFKSLLVGLCFGSELDTPRVGVSP